MTLGLAVLVVVLSGASTGWLLLGPLATPAPEAAAAEAAGDATGGADDTAVGPHLVTLEQLQRAAAQDGPLYWAGARPDQRYELTRTGSGAVFVRYLPAGAPAGTDDAYLTVATYPQPRGSAHLETAAAEEGARSWRTTSGALVVADPRAPLSAYFSFEDVDFQVEVYSPTAGAAEELVLGGGVSEVPPAGAGVVGGRSG